MNILGASAMIFSVTVVMIILFIVCSNLGRNEHENNRREVWLNSYNKGDEGIAIIAA